MNLTPSPPSIQETVEITISDVRIIAQHTFDVHIRVYVKSASLGDVEKSGRARLDITSLLALPDVAPEYHGEKLTSMLFSDPQVRDLWVSWYFSYFTSYQQRARVLLSIDSDVNELHNLPWETLRLPKILQESLPATISLRAGISFARRPAHGGTFNPSPSHRVLRTLAVISSPPSSTIYGLTPFDVESQITALKEAFCWSTLTVLASKTAQPPTLHHLQEALRENYDIVCFICHGYINEGMPTLYLEDEHGQPQWLERTVLQRMFAEVHPPQLVVLCACQSATRDVHGSLGHAFTAQGVSAVIAINDIISANSAREYLTAFGKHLFYGNDVYEATREARARVKELQYWWRPVLYARSDVMLLPSSDQVFLARKVFQHLTTDQGRDHGQVIAQILRQLDQHLCGEEISAYQLAGAVARARLGTESGKQVARYLAHLALGRPILPPADPTPPEMFSNIGEMRRRMANDLYSLLQGNVLATRMARTLYQVFHQYGVLAPAPEHNSRDTVLRLADFPDEPIVVANMGSPLLTFSHWIGTSPSLDANGSLQRALSGWRGSFCKEMGWQEDQVFIPQLPKEYPDACLYLTIRLSAQEADLEQSPFSGQLTADAWLWCSDLRNHVRIDTPHSNSTFELSGERLAQLYGDLFARVRHIIAAYSNNLVIEWMVPWRLLDWPFGQHINVVGLLGPQSLGSLYPLVVRLDHALYNQIVVPWFAHLERFVDHRYIPISREEVRVWPPTDAGDYETSALVLIIPTTIRIASSRQLKKTKEELLMLLSSKAAILLWSRANDHRRGTSTLPTVEDFERFIINQPPARPPASLVNRSDLVVLWDDLARLP